MSNPVDPLAADLDAARRLLESAIATAEDGMVESDILAKHLVNLGGSGTMAEVAWLEFRGTRRALLRMRSYLTRLKHRKNR